MNLSIGFCLNPEQVLIWSHLISFDLICSSVDVETHDFLRVWFTNYSDSRCQIMKFEAGQVIDFPKKKTNSWHLKKKMLKKSLHFGLLVCAKFTKIVNPGLKNARTGFHPAAPETPRGCILAIHGDGIQKVLSCGHVVTGVLASGSTSVSPFSNERRNDLRRWERGQQEKQDPEARKWFWKFIHPTFNMTFGCSKFMERSMDQPSCHTPIAQGFQLPQ